MAATRFLIAKVVGLPHGGALLRDNYGNSVALSGSQMVQLREIVLGPQLEGTLLGIEPDGRVFVMEAP